jgi:internalin A
MLIAIVYPLGVNRSISIMKLSRLVLSSSKVRFLMTGMTMMFLAQPFLSGVASASPQQPEPKSFETWCSQRESVPVPTRHTIDILLEKAGTKDCKLADRQLKTLITLNLSENQISDVKPLAGLTNLTILGLGRNQISDVKPLAGLTNLIELSLSENKIIDVKPLGGLTNLTYLFLLNNQISDVKPLAGLTNLTNLDLGDNPIAVKVCPVPEYICKF